nr:hypothetical protein JLTIEETK_JLTIEETK_CDS_0003 [Microvirus sp.]
MHRSLTTLKFIVMKPVWRFFLIVAEAVISAVKTVFVSSSSQKD